MTAGATEIEKAILNYLVTELLYDKDIKGLKTSDSLLESGTLKSIDILQIVTFCEETFGVEIPDPDVLPENFETVAAIAQLVERLRS